MVMVATIYFMPSSVSAPRKEPSRDLLLDLVALFNTEAAHAVCESERVRLANEARELAELALHTSAKTRAA